ncbi:hypothetical protein Q669_30315 [Labrenzia sp. C1B10]|nr:hypothetical protein Q669_30315 [Labrenzia sp. C1B10]ERS00060.1 hypothetical protein Q675_09705 [Labrenzia sp. C1B70]
MLLSGVLIFSKKERAAGMVPAALNLISRLWLP